MTKIKVLWLSGTRINRRGDFFYETWLTSMAQLLVKSGRVELYNVVQDSVEDVVEIGNTIVREWVVPVSRSNQNRRPTASLISHMGHIMNVVNPDIVHIWGMEKNWGLLTSTGVLGDKVLLEIQGIKYTCAEAYYAGLSMKDLLSTVRVQEIVFSSRSMFSIKRQFNTWGAIEREMIKAHNYVGTPSEWVRDHVRFNNVNAATYKSKLAMRQEFLDAMPWQYRNDEVLVVFASSSFAISYKGIHNLLNVLVLLKIKYRNVKLKIAGDWPINNPFYRKTGYLKWFVSKAKKIGVLDLIDFLGPLNSEMLLKQFYKSDVFVVPSYVESYSLALAEAMAVGVPCVASYVGGMSELAVDNESVLFFSPNDYVKCAGNIDRIKSDKDLALKLSDNARQKTQGRNDTISVVNRQLEIYDQVIKNNRISTS